MQVFTIKQEYPETDDQRHARGFDQAPNVSPADFRLLPQYTGLVPGKRVCAGVDGYSYPASIPGFLPSMLAVFGGKMYSVILRGGGRLRRMDE